MNDLLEHAFSCLKNVISNGQPVSPRVLQLFVYDLQMSENSRRRLRAFKLLEKIRISLDINDEAFIKLELVKGAFGLSSNITQNEKYRILCYIQEQSEKGEQLPIDVMLVLGSYVNEKATLGILYNASKHLQIINYNLLSKLVNTFNSANFDDITYILIEIFENVTRNNQTLSKKLLDKLETTLDSCTIELEKKVLSIFVRQAQKGEQLSRKVIDKILDRIIKKETNFSFKHELLNCIGSIVLQLNKDELTIYKGLEIMFCYIIIIFNATIYGHPLFNMLICIYIPLSV